MTDEGSLGQGDGHGAGVGKPGSKHLQSDAAPVGRWCHSQEELRRSRCVWEAESSVGACLIPGGGGDPA